MSDIIVRLRDPLDCPDTKSVFALCREAADLLEANAAEITNLRQSCTDLEARSARLFAENEKLRAVFKAAMYISRHSSNDSWSAFVAACESAGGFEAAVEQSEAGERKTRPKTAAETCGREGCLVTGFYERCEKCSMMIQPNWPPNDEVEVTADTQSKGSPDARIPRGGTDQ